MRRLAAVVLMAAIVGIGLAAWAQAPATTPASAPAASSQYVMDPAHSSATFRIEHAGISWVAGRFDELAGTCAVVRGEPAQCAFEMTIKTASVNTNNAQRDAHLRTADFFDANQFPEMTFKSTSVKTATYVTTTMRPGLGAGGGFISHDPNDPMFEVTGNFTLRGVTKPVTVYLCGGRETEFPKGKQRVGFFADFSIKRTDFGMKTMAGVGDDVKITVSFEAVAK